MSHSQQTDKYKSLFHEMELETPSDEFMKYLMLRIEKEAVAKRKKRHFLLYMSIAAGIIGILITPAIVFFFMKIDIQFTGSQLSGFFPTIVSIFKKLEIKPEIISIGCTILILLISDTLIRKRVRLH